MTRVEQFCQRPFELVVAHTEEPTTTRQQVISAFIELCASSSAAMDAAYAPLGSKYGAVTGGNGLSLIRGKDAPAARSPPRTRTAAELPAKLAQDDHEDTPLISRSIFNELRNATMDETISAAGSDDEQAIPEDEEQAGSLPPGVSTTGLTVGQIDELTLLLADTPLKKLRHKDAQAAKATAAGDPWAALELRQQQLALAKLCAITGPYSAQKRYPLLLAEAHYKLAAAYADMQCTPQANEHAKRAQQVLPGVPSGETLSEVTAFKRDINVLLGEMLLLGQPPKPQAALQYMYKADGSEDWESIQDPGIKLLIAQCHALLGTTKLHEAGATRRAREALQQRVDGLTARLQTIKPKSADYEVQQRKIRDSSNELQEEEAFEHALLEEAKEQLDRATHILMDVIDGEERRLSEQRERQGGGGGSGPAPLVLTLWRLACEFGFKCSLVYQMMGDVQKQLKELSEIHTAHNSYECVPPALMVRVQQEESAALVLRAGTWKEEQDRKDDLNKALEVLDSLLQLQEERYSHSPSKQAVARAETLKLTGNVHLALAEYQRAQEKYQEALQLFVGALGNNHNLVLDLEQRIQEVQAFMDS